MTKLGNNNGIKHEERVKDILETWGLKEVYLEDYKFDPDSYDDCFVKNVTYPSFYRGSSRRTEYIIKSEKLVNKFGTNVIRMECKVQTVAGTAREKLMYTIADLKYQAPETYSVIIVDGSYLTEDRFHLVHQEWCRDMSLANRQPNTVEIVKLDNINNHFSRVFC